MSADELSFIMLLMANLAAVTLASRIGKDFIVCSILANLLITNIISAKIVCVFGVPTTIGNATFAGIFLASDILCEKYGRIEAKKALNIGVFSLLWIVFFGPLISVSKGVDISEGVSDALTTIFSGTPRIVSASLTAYFLSTTLNIYLYDYIKRITSPSYRNILIRSKISTISGQFFDQLIFVTLAFAGTLPLDVLGWLYISGMAVKFAVSILDAPFLLIAIAPNKLAKAEEH